MLTIDRHRIIAIIIINFAVKDSSSATCTDEIVQKSYNYSIDLFQWDGKSWYNTTFWGGYELIASQDNISPHCWNPNREYSFLVLSDKHPPMSELSAEYQTLQACTMDQIGQCIRNVTVQVMNCDGHILYRFREDHKQSVYICFDRIYEDTCENVALPLPAAQVNNSVSLVKINWRDLDLGWYDSVYGGRNFTIPLIKDVNSTSRMCYGKNKAGFYVQETQPLDIGETPVGMRVCLLSDHNYDQDYHEIKFNNYWFNCNVHVFVRVCNGRLQIDLSLSKNLKNDICLVHYNNVKVVPEIGHIEDNGVGGSTMYSPFLQFRCSFEMIGSVPYKVNWYINGTLWMETGPSIEADDLVFKGKGLNELRLGYQVKCGVVAVGTNGTSESFSDDFYAGWKISDTYVKLSKNGSAVLDIEQTVPLGCAYGEGGQETCEEILSLVDPNQTPEVACKAGIHVVNADDDTNGVSYHTIKSLKMGEKWNGTKIYRFRLSTIDHDYDDKLYFEMELLVTTTAGQTPRVNSGRDTQLIITIDVVVTYSEVNRNKRCYSHVDPHMRTADGRYYEQQREGDHMLYRNLAYQSEVQEYARYCSKWYTNGPVCACGVAIRSGADVFMINRCGNFTVLDFLECGDGGIIDVERVHDYRYKVTTPIGTIVDISLHSWGKTMNIDIYLSAKDYKNTDGLCGYFDGGSSNDFRHRDGVTVSNGNTDYAFSNSWRLSDDENFLTNDTRKLEKWNRNNGGNRPCLRPNSITKNKCEFERRKRREVIVRKGKTDSRQNIMPTSEMIRVKRSTEYAISDEKARALCNSSIYEAPAVREFSDKLADEDPEVVLTQCVYDVIQGNDTVWAEAHVNALNNIASSVISLNPVFAATNSESVKTFLSQTCLNNCSGHGECLGTGLCICEGMFRGPDCGIDLRIPPIIYDIQDGGLCDTANETECNCFVIRTDNIFDGFTYEISSYELLFNGTRKQQGKSVHMGEYEDIFTGVCCVPQQRKRRSVDDSSDPSIMMFDIEVSNDGSNFGQSKSVYVFDSTCIHFELVGGIVTIVLKDGYCFIGGVCVEQNSTSKTRPGCYVCDSKSIPYAWTHADCSEKVSGLSKSALIGITIALSLVALIVIVLLLYCNCCKSSKRTVDVVAADTAHAVDNNAKTAVDMTTINAVP